MALLNIVCKWRYSNIGAGKNVIEALNMHCGCSSYGFQFNTMKIITNRQGTAITWYIIQLLFRATFCSFNARKEGYKG
jgi:hypothetical protein